jgi:outer membrane protein assembly factor BamB
LRQRPSVLFLSFSALAIVVLVGLGLSRGTSDAATPSNVQVLTYHNDGARTGQNLQEKLLNSMTVDPSRFGRVGFFPTDGLVDAEPLYVSNLMLADGAHNVVFVATEHDSVYAFDADTLATLWQTTVLPANETPSDKRNCEQVSPEIGITSTPVISFDGDQQVLYLVAMSKDGEGNYFQRLHALDITSGAEISGSPTTIQAEFPNLQGATVFDPQQYKERAALLLQDGIIYTTWASHCDEAPYMGWVMAYDAATLQRTAVLNVTPNGTDGAIWMSCRDPARRVMASGMYMCWTATAHLTQC